MTFNVGDEVEWDRWRPDPVGVGVVSCVTEGRVYVKYEQTNTRGRRRTRTVEVWFGVDEVHLLRQRTASRGGVT